MRRTASLVVLWALAGSAGAAAPASTEGDAPELMLFEEIPKIVTATRTEISLPDTPSAVTVITADEIRASGATSLQELLQLVPGLDLMQVSRGDLNVASRGFVTESSSSVLVMIDGRSVYLDFFGITLWEHLNVALLDIERIEVVQGPGSALYGANAFSGTINIVTKSARDLPALTVRTGAGPDVALGTATGAVRLGRWAVKGSAQYRRRDQFRNVANPAANTDYGRHDAGPLSRFANARAEYSAADGTQLRLSTGASWVRGQTGTAIGVFESRGPISYAQIDLERGRWRAQTFYTVADLDLETVVTTGPPTPSSASVRSSVLDLDLQRTFGWGRHDVLAGANVRRQATDSRTILGSGEAETLYSGFVQDAYPLTDRLTGYLGGRFDDHPTSGFQISPRVALVYKLGEQSRLRASFARSFQSPTFIESYSSYAASPFVTVVGNEDLDPVWLTAWEVGGHFEPVPRLRLDVDLFHYTYKDFHAFTVVGAGVPTELGFVNQGRTVSWGGEARAEWVVRPFLRGFASYAFQQANGPLEGYTPRHNASLGVRGSLGAGLRYALTGHYAGHADLEPGALTASTLPDTDIPSRLMVDGFLGWQFRKGVEIGLHGRNLFHQVRRQYPIGDEIGSELLVTLTAEF